MDLDRLSLGEKIAAGAAIVLFIFMFFDWFSAEVNIGGAGASEGVNAWDALDWIPIFLVITIIAALGIAVLRLVDTQYEVTSTANAIVGILGGVSVLLILYRIIDTPGASGSAPGFSFDVSPAFGIFVSLIAAAGVGYGGYKAMQEEGGSFSDLSDRFGGGGGSGGGFGGGGGGHTQPQPPAQQQPPVQQPPAPQAPPADPGTQPPAGGPPPPPPAQG